MEVNHEEGQVLRSEEPTIGAENEELKIWLENYEET